MCTAIASVIAVLGLSLVAYMILKHKGWLPTFGKHKLFQGTVTASQLAIHKTPNDCWVAYFDKVYVMTDYANKHPAGPSTITGSCGGDGTAAFSGVHPESLMNVVRTEFIGDLVVSDSVGSTPSSVKTFSLPEIAKHNDKAKDCWVVFHNKVYDMTEYAQTHTGNGASPNLILKSCGADGTSSFENFHNEGMLGSVQKYLVGEVGNGEQSSSSSNVAAPSKPTPQSQPQDTSGDSEDTPLAPRPPTPAPAPTPALAPGTCTGYTLQDLQKHSTAGSDCWIVYNDIVFDMTAYNHSPSGVITSRCGTDATSSLQGGPTTHQAAGFAERHLRKLKKGVLSNKSGQVAC